MAPRMDAISNVEYNHNDENLVYEAGYVLIFWFGGSHNFASSNKLVQKLKLVYNKLQL